MCMVRCAINVKWMNNSTVFIDSNVWNAPWHSDRIVALNSMSVSTEHAKEEMNPGTML